MNGNFLITPYKYFKVHNTVKPCVHYDTRLKQKINQAFSVIQTGNIIE